MTSKLNNLDHTTIDDQEILLYIFLVHFYECRFELLCRTKLVIHESDLAQNWWLKCVCLVSCALNSVSNKGCLQTSLENLLNCEIYGLFSETCRWNDSMRMDQNWGYQASMQYASRMIPWVDNG